MKFFRNALSKSLMLLLSVLFCDAEAIAQQNLPYKNSTLPLDARVKDLLSRLTLEEKVSLMGYRSKVVPRLNIPAYNGWNESLHGVARAGEATVSPQAIGMTATFYPNLLQHKNGICKSINLNCIKGIINCWLAVVRLRKN